MRDLHVRYPEYGFARHKGYSTPAHMRALGAHGPCPEHRRSFVNVSSVTCGKDLQAAFGDPGGDAVGDVDGGLDDQAPWSDAGQEN
jgi:ribonuclease HII